MKILEKHVLLFSVIGFITGMVSCKHEPVPAPPCVAGAGGNVTIVAYLFHHDSLITNKPGYLDTVYVKFNTQNFPGPDPSDYDAMYFGDTLENLVHLEELKCGDYYIYGVGLDTISSPGFPFRVTGGIPFSTTATSGEIVLHVPVVE